MRKIFIDLEMNPIDMQYEQERSICNYEVIEIGAVMLDDSNCEISQFMTYIKPVYNSCVEERITRLTGITTEMIYMQDDYESAIRRFFDWCGDYEDIEGIYAWSDHDYRQIVNEMKLKGIEVTPHIQSLLNLWNDFQKIFSGLVGLNRPMGLEKAIEAVGREFEGKAHDALTDAVNTAGLYVASKDDKETKRMIELLEKTRRPANPLKTALGDLFDFGNLDID